MNPKLPVRSLRNQPEVCYGCGNALSQNRTITVDEFGNPMRFDSKCKCYTEWLSKNATGFTRRGRSLVT